MELVRGLDMGTLTPLDKKGVDKKGVDPAIAKDHMWKELEHLQYDLSREHPNNQDCSKIVAGLILYVDGLTPGNSGVPQDEIEGIHSGLENVRGILGKQASTGQSRYFSLAHAEVSSIEKNWWIT